MPQLVLLGIDPTTGQQTQYICQTGLGSATPVNLSYTPPTDTAHIINSSQVATIQIVVVADLNNTGIIYVGGSGVTSSTGIPLRAGSSAVFYLTNANLIYALASAASQNLIIQVY